MSSSTPQIIAGLFRAEGGYEVALAELRWSLRQNPGFWRQAVLYVDPLCEDDIRPWRTAFQEVVVDHGMPDVVRQHPKWNCKGWWSRQGVLRFGKVLYCDFDIVVVRPPDESLWGWLARGPRFLYMPHYQSAQKVVGCGIAYYDTQCDWDRYLDLIFHKWRCDERAWTETMSLTKERQLAGGYDMNPRIVNWDWLLENNAQRDQTYLIHGLSEMSPNWRVFRQLGYAPSEVRFRVSWRARLNGLLVAMVRRKGRAT